MTQRIRIASFNFLLYTSAKENFPKVTKGAPGKSLHPKTQGSVQPSCPSPGVTAPSFGTVQDPETCEDRNPGILDGNCDPPGAKAAGRKRTLELQEPPAGSSQQREAVEGTPRMRRAGGGWRERVLDFMTGAVLAIELLAACQDIEFLRPLKTTTLLEKVYDLVRSVVRPWIKDRFMAPDIEAAHRSGKLRHHTLRNTEWNTSQNPGRFLQPPFH
ncbi:hypothetical protein STEG23_025224 [Scotinomys teguina]